ARLRTLRVLALQIQSNVDVHLLVGSADRKPIGGVRFGENAAPFAVAVSRNGSLGEGQAYPIFNKRLPIILRYQRRRHHDRLAVWRRRVRDNEITHPEESNVVVAGGAKYGVYTPRKPSPALRRMAAIHEGLAHPNLFAEEVCCSERPARPGPNYGRKSAGA